MFLAFRNLKCRFANGPHLVSAIFLFLNFVFLAFIFFMSFLIWLSDSANVSRETVMPCATKNFQLSICSSVSWPFQPTKLTPEAVNDQCQCKLRFPSSAMSETDNGSDQTGFCPMVGVVTVLIIEVAGLAFCSDSCLQNIVFKALLLCMKFLNSNSNSCFDLFIHRPLTLCCDLMGLSCFRPQNAWSCSFFHRVVVSCFD